MNNVHKHNNFFNIPSSQTFRPYFHLCLNKGRMIYSLQKCSIRCCLNKDFQIRRGVLQIARHTSRNQFSDIRIVTLKSKLYTDS
jgi:hypothetical protein